tara:strand:+ start:95 stop:1156 length:1062 start_codon:yes stop_codon:yes gene_type:complete
MAFADTVNDSEAHFQVAKYDGTSSGAKTFTFPGTTDMQGDFIWFKQYNATRSHVQIDSVRGVTKAIQSDTDDAEHTNDKYLASFDSDGFTTGSSQDNGSNTSGGEYVAYCWKANGSGSSNTTGTINTTATSANATSKFSIITYTGNATSGATIGHGIGVAPKFLIIKSRSQSGSDFVTWINPMAVNEYMYLNSTAVKTSDTDFMNSTLPSSTLITLGNKGNVNANTENYVAYAAAEVSGWTRFGSYVGNVNADGKFIWLGFKPALFIVKETGNAENWIIYDNKRGDYGNANPNDQHLTTNTTAAESSGTAIDFLSNGIKLRSNAGHLNEGSYIFAAWAEMPFVNSEGVPGNAQ